MKRIYILKSSLKICLLYLVLALHPLSGFSQLKGDEGNPFEKSVSLLSTDGSFSYYRIDLRLLPGFFERSYLLDQFFADSKVLIDKTDINSDYLDIRVSRDEEMTVIANQIEAYMIKAKEMGEKTSDADKKELVKKYNKYK